MVIEAFPDQQYFHEKVRLTAQNDDRCRHIAIDVDWYYIDDLADEFFVKEYGSAAFEQYLGHRICLCDPYDDGGPLLDFLQRIVC